MVRGGTHAQDIFWESTRHLDFFFATYRNVTNAGEFLNLTLPLTASLALVALISKQNAVVRALALSTGVILMAGVLANGSKVAPLFAAGLAVGFGVLQAPFLRLLLSRSNRIVCALTLLLIALAGVTVVQSLSLSVTFNRWHRLLADADGSSTLNSRWLADQACVKALPEAEILGFGRGTFSSIFPYYSGEVAGNLAGFWMYAHNDYLQTMMEWGLAGSFFWAVVLGAVSWF